MAEEFVNYVISSAVPKAMTVEEIATATTQDKTLSAVIKSLHSGAWNNNTDGVDKTAYNKLAQLRDELSVSSVHNVLLRGTRIVLPVNLQQRAIDLAHVGHQGIVKTKALLREKVWFVGIDKMAEDHIKSCLACQSTTPQERREPLQMSPLPTSPWCELSADMAELPTGDYILVVTDDYSRYPLVEVISSTSSSAVIPKLDKLFAEFGTPSVLKTDNGPPFNGAEFAKFSQRLRLQTSKNHTVMAKSQC